MKIDTGKYECWRIKMNSESHVIKTYLADIYPVENRLKSKEQKNG